MADVSLRFAEVHVGHRASSARSHMRYFGRALRPLARPLGPQLAVVRYPLPFRAAALAVLGLLPAWVCNYSLAVLPGAGESSEGESCKSADDRLIHNARMLFVYFAWFAIARSSLLVPCIAAHVAHVLFRARGFWLACIANLVLRDGPLYVFVVGSLLLGFRLVEGSSCLRHSPSLYLMLSVHCVCSCLLSASCFALAYWHTKLLCEATHDMFGREEKGAPRGTLQRFQTVAFCPQHLGDDASRLCSSECTICLLPWTADDAIKVTPCGHAFHEVCLGSWLQTARTCPMCRCDLVQDASGAKVPAEDRHFATTSPQMVGPTVAAEPGEVSPVVRPGSNGEGATRGRSFGSSRFMEQEVATRALCDARMVSMEIQLD